jgi:hypothetical protein
MWGGLVAEVVVAVEIAVVEVRKKRDGLAGLNVLVGIIATND